MAGGFSLLSKPFGDDPTKQDVDEVISEDKATSDISPGVRQNAPHAGEQDLGENAVGGLGRHLGLTSTTFLM